MASNIGLFLVYEFMHKIEPFKEFDSVAKYPGFDSLVR